MERRFTNELGNPILISVREVEHTLEALGTGVEIEVEGPNSISSNLLTHQEAAVLAEVLLRYHLVKQLKTET